MLLRLLPIATPSQPAPPTILFTLPMPTHPYTARSLPLPPNLLAHRSVCMQEDIECPNVLLGEKSSWISGIIDDVTFSLPAGRITVNLIDGSSIDLSLESACLRMLQRVVHEVQLSFAPPPAPAVDAPSARSSTSSVSSVASASSSSSSSGLSRPTVSIPSSSRQSTSSLLLSLLSPLIQGSGSSQQSQIPAPRSAPAQPSARVHRRQARSLLVDTFRLHVLPALKQQLPTAYLPWVIASETSRKMHDFEKLREEIDEILDTSGVDRAAHLSSRSAASTSSGSSRHRRSYAGSTCSDSDSDSESADSDESPSPVTPGTSIFSSSACGTPVVPRRSSPSPQSFLLSIPPAHVLPANRQAAYASCLARLTRLASRMQAIKKLMARYEREEGKRRWLESLERGRAGDKALRRAFSNGLFKGNLITAEPIKASKLWRSISAADIRRAEEQEAVHVHPAMMTMSMTTAMGTGTGTGTGMADIETDETDLSTESEPDVDVESVGRAESDDDDDDDRHLVSYGLGSSSAIKARRPSLVHSDDLQHIQLPRGDRDNDNDNDNDNDAESDHCERDVPGLLTSKSDESLAESEDSWDHEHSSLHMEMQMQMQMRVVEAALRLWANPPTFPPPRQSKKLLPVFEEDTDVEMDGEIDRHIITYGPIGVVYA